MILMVSNDGYTGCVYPGVDVNAKTVEVLPTDLAARDEWISIMAEGKETDPFHGQDSLSKPSMDGHEFYVSRLKQCGVAPCRVARTPARSMMLRSSRTLPGQARAW